MPTDAGVERLGYLVGEFPLTHAHYLERELAGLGRLGLSLVVVAVRAGEARGPAVSREVTYLLPFSLASYARAHLSYLREHPGRYWRTMVRALSVPRHEPFAMLKALAHFAEAVVAERRFLAARVHHIHVHFASSVALHLARLSDVPLSVTIHGSGEFDDAIGFRLREKVASAAWVRAICSYGASQVMRWSPPEQWGKVKVLRLGIDPGRESPRPPARAQPVQVVFAGRLAAVKGLPVLLHAVARARIATSRSFEVTIVGGGPERAALEELSDALGLANVVRFAGPQPNSRLRELMADSHIFVMSSFAESLPVVLMEAMASGMACVAPWVGGIPELVETGRSGLLVPPGDVQSLQEALVKLVEDEDLRKSLGESGRQRVLSLHDADTQIARLADAIRLVEEPPEAEWR